MLAAENMTYVTCHLCEKKAGVSLQDYVSCDNVMCGSRSLNKCKMKRLHMNMSV